MAKQIRHDRANKRYFLLDGAIVRAATDDASYLPYWRAHYWRPGYRLLWCSIGALAAYQSRMPQPQPTNDRRSGGIVCDRCGRLTHPRHAHFIDGAYLCPMEQVTHA